MNLGCEGNGLFNLDIDNMIVILIFFGFYLV